MNIALTHTEEGMIREAIGKTGTTRACDGYRYHVMPMHSWPLPEDHGQIPAFEVNVQRAGFYRTIQGRDRKHYRNVRTFICDGLTLQGLKAIPAQFNA